MKIIVFQGVKTWHLIWSDGKEIMAVKMGTLARLSRTSRQVSVRNESIGTMMNVAHTIF